MLYLIIGVLSVLVIILLIMLIPKNHKDIDRVEEYKSYDRPISIGGWFLISLGMLVPILNVGLLIYYGFTRHNKGDSIKAWSRLTVLLFLISLGLYNAANLVISLMQLSQTGYADITDLFYPIIYGLLALSPILIPVIVSLSSKDKDRLHEIRSLERKWLGVTLISLIPIVNFIYLIVYALDKSGQRDLTIKNWAKFTLIMMAISIIGMVIFIGCMVAIPGLYEQIIASLEQLLEQIQQIPQA